MASLLHHNLTLTAVGRAWVGWLDMLAIAALPVGLAVAGALSAFGVARFPVVLAIVIAGDLALAVAHWLCFYRCVSCPACGHPLTRFKNGKNMPMTQAYRALAAGKPCRSCGWFPES